MKDVLVNGAKWTSLGKILNLFAEFTFGIILARLLTPNDFGVIAILSVFISLTSVFINSGMNQSLIRDNQLNEKDYSSVFYFNIFLGLTIFLIVVLLSEKAEKFFKLQDLGIYIDVLAIGIIINSFSFVQSVKLVKDLNFKILNLISIISVFISGSIAVLMAYFGYGIWSLIFKIIINQSITTISLLLYNKWLPEITFDKKKFKKHFYFGMPLLLSGIIGQLHGNILNLSIAKIFSPSILGYYNRAELFKNTISQNIESIMTSVSYPTLAKIQDDKILFYENISKITRITFYIVCLLMLYLFITADYFIPLLLGRQWIESAVFLKYIIFLGILYPLVSININAFNILGKPRIYLTFQIVSLTGSLLALFIGSIYSFKFMLVLFIINSVLCYMYILILYKIILHVKFKSQICPLRHTLFLSFLIIIVCLLSDSLLADSISPIISLCILTFIYSLVIFIYGHLTKHKEFVFLWTLISSKLELIKHKSK